MNELRLSKNSNGSISRNALNSNKQSFYKYQ